MELKQVIKLFKNYKKDEKILEKTEKNKTNLSFEDIRILGSTQFFKFCTFDEGRMANAIGLNSNTIYFLKRVNDIKDKESFIFDTQKATFNNPVKVISFEEFEKWVIENYSDIPRVKRYIESLNSKKYEETLLF